MNCVECGEVINAEFMEPVRTNILNRQLCFNCLFWTEYVETKSDHSHLVVNNNHYVIGPATGYQGGFGGAKFNIKFNDGREVTTTNLWMQGDIPERFRDRLPNNAVFVN